MKMINSYIRSLKFLNYLILTIPSNPILLVASSQQRYNSAKIVFQINCQVSTSAGRFQKAQKLNGKGLACIHETWRKNVDIKVSTC